MEIPSYSEDSYAEKFLVGKTVFPDDTRIFHRPGYQYDDVVALGKSQFDGLRLAVDLTHLSGAPGVLVVRYVRPGVLRIQFGRPGAAFEESSPMLLTEPLDSPVGEGQPQIAFQDLPSKYSYCFDGYTLELEKSPFLLRVVSPKGETIFESETEKLVGMHTTPPLGLRRSSGQNWAFLSWRIRNQDRLFGLGEKFTKFEKTGTRATIWQADTCGSSTTDMSYKAVPVVFSTAGWALMLHSSYRSYWELGSFSYATGGALVEDDRLDLFLILAPSLKEQIRRYTALTGRPALPPRWAFGLWMSRAAYRDRRQLSEVAERLRAEDIPCDVLHIDPTWLGSSYYNDIGVEVCNFTWDAAAWGDPRTLFRDFATRGFNICLWINPYLSEDSHAYAEARARGFLVKTTGGEPARLELDLAAGILDFTNPAAKAWWQEKLSDLMKVGASTFKVDFGDRVPENALFANGRGGDEMHNLYPHLYAEAVYEVVERARGVGMVWRRPGYIGSQRFPGCWAGDTQVSWEGMAGALRGGLSAGFTGESFWSHDIGGFVGAEPGEELYIRWAQWGLLSPFARFHGTTPREPWHYGPRAVEVVQNYTRLRYSLLPYLLACARESVDSGLPILRPMVLEFPGEPRIDAIDDQYMLGADLLVAPVMQPGAGSRTVYFPKGQWWPLERAAALTGSGAGTGALPAVISGPGFHQVDAPLEHLPVFIRAGAILPRYRQAPQHLKDTAPREWLLDIYPGESQRILVIDEPGYSLRLEYRFENGSGRLEVSPAPINLAVRLIDRRQPSFIRATGGTMKPGDGAVNFVVDASQGVTVDFRV